MADNTLILDARAPFFDAGLPLTGAIRLPFTASHWWDARDLTSVAVGGAVTSWADRITGLALTNAVGGTKNMEGAEPYVGFSGTSGALSVAGSSLPQAEIGTTIVVARVNIGDVFSGEGPIFSHSTGGANLFGVFQKDTSDGVTTQAQADVAHARQTAGGGSAFQPAYRDAWHVYMLAGMPGGTGRFGVDGGSALFTPDPAITTKVGLSLAIAGSARRRVRVTQVITTSAQLNAAQMLETYQILRSKRAALTWRGTL